MTVRLEDGVAELLLPARIGLERVRAALPSLEAYERGWATRQGELYELLPARRPFVSALVACERCGGVGEVEGVCPACGHLKARVALDMQPPSLCAARAVASDPAGLMRVERMLETYVQRVVVAKPFPRALPPGRQYRPARIARGGSAGHR